MKNRLKLESSMDSNFKTMIFAIALLLLMIIIGVLGYIVIENFEFYEALYMTVITMSTVGFKEVISGKGTFQTSILMRKN
ncbi:MAG: ion channel, partial [Bacteroidales bacterium]|nr:ion channel [Bacteroidales bacterium]